MRWPLMSQIKVELPWVTKAGGKDSSNALGRKFGVVVTDLPAGLSWRTSGGKERLAVLEQTGWRVSGRHGAAELLGLKPTTLEYRMTKLGIHRRR